MKLTKYLRWAEDICSFFFAFSACILFFIEILVCQYRWWKHPFEIVLECSNWWFLVPKIFQKIRPKKYVPKSDTFLGIWLYTKCVTFTHDSVGSFWNVFFLLPPVCWGFGKFNVKVFSKIVRYCIINTSFQLKKGRFCNGQVGHVYLTGIWIQFSQIAGLHFQSNIIWKLNILILYQKF